MGSDWTYAFVDARHRASGQRDVHAFQDRLAGVERSGDLAGPEGLVTVVQPDADRRVGHSLGCCDGQ